jgi:hypothetical protein
MHLTPARESCSLEPKNAARAKTKHGFPRLRLTLGLTVTKMPQCLCQKKSPGVAKLDGGVAELDGCTAELEVAGGRPRARLDKSPRPPRRRCRTSIRGGAARIGGEGKRREQEREGAPTGARSGAAGGGEREHRWDWIREASTGRKGQRRRVSVF